jgi:hypothetical protein
MWPEKDPSILTNATTYPIILSQIYNRAIIGIIATIVNSSILVFALKSVVSLKVLMFWFLSMIIFTLARLMLTIAVKRNPEKLRNVHKSKQLLIIGIGIAGILWGSTAIVLFPSHSVAHQVFIAFVLAGMVAGAVSAFSSIMPVFISFLIPALTPIIIRFLILGDEIHLVMAAMTILFGILTFFTAKSANTETWELITLKETFSDMLEERTKELKRTNGQLEQEIEKRRDVEKTLLAERDTLKQMISEVKTLRGFIPICSSCHKIRDDAGYWQRIEKYIQERSDAKFSHSLCPECLSKYT